MKGVRLRLQKISTDWMGVATGAGGARERKLDEKEESGGRAGNSTATGRWTVTAR